MSLMFLPPVAFPPGSVVGMLSYPVKRATSSARSQVARRSCLNEGMVTTPSDLSTIRSSFSNTEIISSSVYEVPRRSLIFSGSKGIFTRSLKGSFTSTIPPTTSPAPSSSTSWQALFIASSAFLASSPFSKIPDASVLNPILLDDFLIFVPLKVAASKSIVETSSVIMVFSPPMIPAIPISFSPSQIMRTSLSRFLS